MQMMKMIKKEPLTWGNDFARKRTMKASMWTMMLALPVDSVCWYHGVGIVNAVPASSSISGTSLLLLLSHNVTVA